MAQVDADGGASRRSRGVSIDEDGVAVCVVVTGKRGVVRGADDVCGAFARGEWRRRSGRARARPHARRGG